MKFDRYVSYQVMSILLDVIVSMLIDTSIVDCYEILYVFLDQCIIGIFEFSDSYMKW